MRSLSLLKPSVISPRNWKSGEPRRVGSRRVASLLPSPSMYVPRSVLMRPMALSRFVSSKSSSVSERSLPRSPRKASSVRGRRPSPSAKFWRRSWSRACGGLRVGVLGRAQEAGELGADGVDVDGHAGVHEGGQADLEGALDDARTLLGGALGDEGGQAGIDEDQALDDDAVALDRHAGGADAGGRRRADRRQAGGRRARHGRPTGGGGEADDVGGGVHAPDSGGGLCQLGCHDARARSTFLEVPRRGFRSGVGSKAARRIRSRPRRCRSARRRRAGPRF